MVREEAENWIKKLINEMKKETSGNYPDPEYRDEVYEALDFAISDMKRIEKLEEMIENLNAALSSKRIIINGLEAENKKLKDGIEKAKAEIDTEIDNDF